MNIFKKLSVLALIITFVSLGLTGCDEEKTESSSGDQPSSECIAAETPTLLKITMI